MSIAHALANKKATSAWRRTRGNAGGDGRQEVDVAEGRQPEPYQAPAGMALAGVSSFRSATSCSSPPAPRSQARAPGPAARRPQAGDPRALRAPPTRHTTATACGWSGCAASSAWPRYGAAEVGLHRDDHHPRPGREGGPTAVDSGVLAAVATTRADGVDSGQPPDTDPKPIVLAAKSASRQAENLTFRRERRADRPRARFRRLAAHSALPMLGAPC